MNSHNSARRRFLQGAFASAALYGIGLSTNRLVAMPAPLTNRLLINLFLDGGPDMRHLVVPAYDATPGSLGQKYWQHRARAHALAAAGQTAQQRWNDDYIHFTVNEADWPGGLQDIGSRNHQVTFGIWREASWLIDMFRAGKAALVFNAVGGQNRAHDLSTLQLNQGNLLSGVNDVNRSGWGGRLARSAQGTAISVARSPSVFCFGPVGNAPNYNANSVDNSDVISVADSRDLGLYDYNPQAIQFYNFGSKIARASKTYHQSLRSKPGLHAAYNKFLEHERKTRLFGQLIQTRLSEVPIPNTIYGLYDDDAGLNLDPAGTNAPRRVLHSRSFGEQVRNVYDVLACNDLLHPNVISMHYGGWDSHGSQRQVPGILQTDPNNPEVNRGIENGFKDIFGGRFGANPTDANALHGGFSALWNALSTADRRNIVITIAGEFGRQVRDNGDYGTDHGSGNLMLVIGEQVAGGLYGEFSQADELAKYDEPEYRTPDITPRTEIDHIFAQVADWVSPNAGQQVFPRIRSNYSGQAPLIEIPGMFNNLFNV